ncbi:hypothetical protein BT69DRAFT_751942 [Atractiella rhizophila]|nr:hypothetical protein BT69DRAFT_751942 [Atractiella rhizophila]
MHTGRTLDGSAEDLWTPATRKVDFSDEAPIVTVSTLLRHAFLVNPSTTSSETLLDYVRAASHLSPSEREAAEVASTEDLQTEWRKEGYEMWKHVFNDVAGFLSEVGGDTGHFHAEMDDVLETLPLRFGEPIEKTWEEKVLVIPAFLRKDVTVKILKEEGKDAEWGKFGKDDLKTILYFRNGVKVVFEAVVDSDVEEGTKREGLAALLMLGKLCRHREGAAEISESGTEPGSQTG